MSLNVAWILFDFGGCLDSDGVHSRKLFFDQFVKNELVTSNQNTLFQEAYSYSDQKVIGESLIVNFNLQAMNERMCFYIAEKLNSSDEKKVQQAAIDITQVQSFYLNRNRMILEKLTSHYQLGIISNFSGNLEVILKEFKLDHYFTFVLDSYHVGFSKPNPEIFKLAISKTNCPSNKLVFIGDNIDRDIMPAKNLGMKTILISDKETTSPADYTLSTLSSLLEVAQIA